MQTFTTQKGNTLEVRQVGEGEKTKTPLYEFILREKKPNGENITLLLKACLWQTDYFISKFVREN